MIGENPLMALSDLTGYCIFDKLKAVPMSVENAKWSIDFWFFFCTYLSVVLLKIFNFYLVSERVREQGRDKVWREGETLQQTPYWVRNHTAWASILQPWDHDLSENQESSLNQPLHLCAPSVVSVVLLFFWGSHIESAILTYWHLQLQGFPTI